MQKKMKTQLVGTALVFTLGFGTITPAVWASDGGVSPVLPAVSVAKLGTFELKNIQMLNQEGSLNVTYTITVHNESNTAIPLIDYMTRLKSKTGQSFAARLLPADKSKKYVYAGSSQDLTYTAQLDELTALNDLTVEIVKWDFSAPNYERSLGKMTIPETYSQALPMEGNRILSVGGTQLNLTLTEFHAGKGVSQYLPSIRLQLENIGSEAVKTPDYQFLLRTPQGRIYPLTLKSQAANMRPNEDTEWVLSGTVPIDEDPSGWQLVITQQVQGVTDAVPVVIYDLYETELSTALNQNNRLAFSAADGMYTAQMNGLYRAPFTDQDLLTADVKVYNPGKTDTLSVPQLSGYFLLDNTVKIDANLVQLSQSTGIRPGDGISIQAVSKIPVDTSFTSIRLVLQEKGADGIAADVLEFPSKKSVQTVPFYRQDDSYTVSDTGRKARYKIAGVNQYAGESSDIVAIQVEIENLEARPKSAPKLVANIETGDGLIYEGQVSDLQSKISPNGKAMLEVWCELPSGTDSSNLHLIMGNAVSQGKLADGTAQPDAYVKPVAFWLPDVIHTVKTDDLSELMIYPYAITLSNIDGYNNTKDFALSMDTTIITKQFSETSTNHNLVFSIKDTNGYVVNESAYKISDIASGNGPLKIGKGQLKITFANPNSEWSKDVDLSIYDEYQGHRKLLATQNNIYMYSYQGR